MTLFHGRPGLRQTLVFLIALLVVLAGSGLQSSAAQPSAAEPSVVCTVYPVYLIAKELASGTALRVKLLLPAELGCPHHYSLTPTDMAGLDRANLILANGLGFEPFLDRLSESGFAARIRHIAPASSALRSEHGDQPNPHLFTTPAGLSAMVDAAASALGDVVSSDSATLLRRNAENLRARLAEVGKEWAEAAGKLAGTPVVVTHSSLDYISSAINLDIVARFELDDEHQHSAHSRLGIEQAIRDRRPVAILTDALEASEEIEALGREHGIPVIALQTLTKGSDADAPNHLESAMKAISASLVPLASGASALR
ncbi:MAG TPA: metal ABC transporter substrate-binding protein [Candidatus Ozemobacteraceae bacterium]|nr:metal ABC transporter substrate-binding protein [Candidatus Ozemobacteraceae bacterium]HQG27571.1 metal ABC transporter substrate-binding protein [Candidatus Ozemobacteraceae bacterium]